MTLASLVLSAVVFVGVMWSFLFVSLLRSSRFLGRLQPLEELPEAPFALSVVIPARDEEKAIEGTVRSLLAQEGVSLSLIVVNDGSTDQTGAILAALAREDERLEIVENPELLPGWLGKTNAMHQGAQRATEPSLLFCDADVHFHPRALVSALTLLEEEQRDFLALLPCYEWKSLVEHAYPAGFMMNIGFFSPRLEDPDYPDEAFGTGAFLLLRREAYQAIGGHETLRGAVADDLTLSKRIKQAGFRVALRLAPQLLRVRMYHGNREALWGLSKNILLLLRGKLWPVPLFALFLLLLFLGGIGGAVLGLALGHTPLFVAGIVLYLGQYFSLFALRSWHQFHPLKLLAYPVVVLVSLASLGRATYFQLTQGAVFWRGRTISLAPEAYGDPPPTNKEKEEER